MVEIDRRHSAPDQTHPNTAQKLFDDSHPAPHPVTDLSGAECKRQPKANEIPTLLPNKETDGCSYSKVPPARKENEQTPPYNTAELYNKSQPSTVRLLTPFTDGKETHDGQGSGVIMGRGSGGECYVATVNHNVSTTDAIGLKVKGDPKVIMPDGKDYKADVKSREPDKDRAFLAVHDVPAAICRPAEFASAPPARGDKGLTVGYPDDTKTPHASPTTYDREVHPNKNGFPKTLEETKGRGEPGDSGGPMRDSSGKVYALVEGPPNQAQMMRRLRGTPINQSEVDARLKQLENQK